LEHRRLRIGQAHQCCGAVGAGGLHQQRVRRLDPGAPVGGAGPAGVHHDQERAIARSGGFGFGVQHRAREAEDHRRDGEHAQQQEPPGRAVADLFVILESKQQHHARKQAADRRGRHRAQDQPEDRQGQQPQQQPGRGETERAEKGHP